jgi:chaperonin GroEL
MQRGVDCLANLLRPTLGPTPRCVALDSSFPNHPPEILDDGATILRRVIQLPDPYADMGAMLLRHTLWQVHQAVGDGTATTAVLLQAIVRHAAPYLAAGGNAMGLKCGLERGLATAVTALKDLARPLEGAAAIARTAETLCHDAEMATLLGEIFDIVGPDGYVQVEAGHSLGLERQYVEGVHWYEGYFSPYFTTDSPKQEARLENPAILISDLCLTTGEQLVPVLEQVAKVNQQSLLIIAQEVSGSALGLLVANHRAGRLRLLAVRAPSYGKQQTGILEDLAILTGGCVVTQASGDRVQDTSLADLGHARLAWANARTFGVLDGKGDPIKLRQRIAQVKAELAATEDSTDREKVRERLGKLLGGIAILQVGAATKVELEARKARAERAVTALRLALLTGVVPGGGTAYLTCQRAVRNLSVRSDEAVGLKVLACTLEEPLRSIAWNSGYEPSTVVDRVKASPPGWGFDARTGQVVDMWAAGILDPVQVLQKALEAAVSGAAMALTTDVLVHHRRPEMVFEP